MEATVAPLRVIDAVTLLLSLAAPLTANGDPVVSDVNRDVILTQPRQIRFDDQFVALLDDIDLGIPQRGL